MKSLLFALYCVVAVLAASGANAQVVVIPGGGGAGGAGGAPSPGAGSVLDLPGLDSVVVRTGPDYSEQIGANAFARGDEIFAAREDLETARHEVRHALQDNGKPSKSLKEQEAAAERIEQLIMRISSLEMLEKDMEAQLGRLKRADPDLTKRLSDNRELQGTLKTSLTKQKTKRRKLLTASE